MGLRIDANGDVRVGKAPTTEYRVRWQNAATGQIATETVNETLGGVKNYIFRTTFALDSHQAANVRAEIWRTYKNTSRRVYTRGGGIQ